MRGPQGLQLGVIDGRAVLSTDGQPLGRVGRVDRLELEIPDLKFPFDLSGGVSRFRSRRCDLRTLAVSLGRGDIEALLERLALDRFGLLDVEIELDGPILRLMAIARVGDDEAPISIAGALRRSSGQKFRLALFDVKVFGFLPVPGPLLAKALLLAMVEDPSAGGDVLPLRRLLGPTDLEIDVLDAALFACLPPLGFRLPERSHVRGGPITFEQGRLVVTYRAGDVREVDESGPLGLLQTNITVPEAWAHEEGRLAFPEAEADLLGGEVVSALAHYRRAAALHPGSPFVTGRLLQLLSASRDTLPEADEWASALLARAPESVPAWLARAAISVGQGRAADAVAVLERLGSQGDGFLSCDQAQALLGAAMLRRSRPAEAAGTGPAPLAELERILSDRPRHRGATRILLQELRAKKRHAELARVLRRVASEAVDPQRQAAILAEVGGLLAGPLSEPEKAREKLEQAVRLDPGCALAYEGLGQVAISSRDLVAAAEALGRARSLYEASSNRVGQARALTALGELAQDAGRVDEALMHMRRAAELDPSEVLPLRRMGELAFGAGRTDEAEAAFAAALSHAGTAEDRALVLRRQAALRLAAGGDRAEVRLLLERAHREAPASVEVLDDLAAVLDAAGETEDLESFLRRGIEAASPEQRIVLLARLADLGRRLGQDRLVRDALAAQAEQGGSAGATAALQLAALALEGEPGLPIAQAAAIIQALLATSGSDLPRAELKLDLARLHARRGDDEAAAATLHDLLEGQVEGAAASAAWGLFVALADRRGDALASAQALVAWADDVRAGESVATRAAHLRAAARCYRERLGFVADAATALERAYALTTDQPAADLFEELLTVLEELGDHARLEAALASRLPALDRNPEQAVRLAALLAGNHDRDDEAAEIYRRVLLAHPSNVAARAGAARLLWRAGNKQQSARHYEALLATEAVAEQHPTLAAEAHLRLGQWARVVGQAEDAARHIDEGLAPEPMTGAPVDVLTEVLEGLGRAEELVTTLARREAHSTTESDRASAARARAGVLERLGRASEATEIYRGLLDQAPDDTEVLARLAELFRREGRVEDLVAPLERLFFLALDGPGPSGRAPALDVETVGLELASGLAQIGQADRGEAVLRRVLEHAPGSAEALGALSDLLLGKGAIDEADEALARRVDAEEDPSVVAALILERARRRAQQPGGELQALALLRRMPIRALTAEGLVERADLAERVGDARDALECLRQAWELAVAGSDEAGASALAERLLRVAQGPGLESTVAIAALEALSARAPDDPSVLEARFGVYGRIEDERARNRAWAGLLEREERLSTPARARIHLALAEAAERDGDLARAEASYRGALALDSEGSLRARALVGHARVLIAWRQVEDARTDLSEALALVADHTGALLALGELTYKNQDWEEARGWYTALAAAPGWQEVISPELLAFRRAELAEMFGDEAEAETAYREVARLDPRHVEAREALAEIALYRQDAVEAARHLGELLALYPADAVDKQRDARERLGVVRHQLGDDTDARYHLELVIAEEQERVSALESLTGVYQSLGLGRQAADLLGRLGRVHPEARGRAQALFRQGELLAGVLGDPAAAADAYLRSSDQDPTFVPTLRRLGEHFFDLGDWENLVQVGDELERLDEAPGEALGLRIALGVLARAGDDEAARRFWPRVLHVDVAAEALVAFGHRLKAGDASAVTAAGRLLRATNGGEITDQVVGALRQLRDGAGGEAPSEDERLAIGLVVAALEPGPGSPV